MHDSVKVVLLGLIALLEFLELVGSREGLITLWVGFADTWWIQSTGASTLAVLLLTALPTLAYCWWSEQQFS
jgi:hypothetical protein